MNHDFFFFNHGGKRGWGLPLLNFYEIEVCLCFCFFSSVSVFLTNEKSWFLGFSGILGLEGGSKLEEGIPEKQKTPQTSSHGVIGPAQCESSRKKKNCCQHPLYEHMLRGLSGTSWQSNIYVYKS